MLIFGMVLYSGIVGNVLYQGALTGEQYVEMLTVTFRYFLESLCSFLKPPCKFSWSGRFSFLKIYFLCRTFRPPTN